MGWQPTILKYRLLAAELGKCRQALAGLSKFRQVCWQPAILEYRLLAAELGKLASRQV